MKLTGLTSRNAHDRGQRFTRAPRARVALAAGLAVAALLGGAATTAQASTVPSAAAQALTATVAPASVTCSASVPITDEHNGSPEYSYIPGNGNVNLYFDSSGAKTDFCPVSVKVGGVTGYQFYVKGTSACLALDASTASIHEGSATACSGRASYTEWVLVGTSSPSYVLYDSAYYDPGVACIYDYTQRPVIYSTCTTSDKFEWLTFP